MTSPEVKGHTPSPDRTTQGDDALSALVRVRDLLRGLQPALNLMARDVLDDIIADQIDPVIAKIGAFE